MTTCRGCAAELIGRSQKAYCSVGCQQQHRQAVLLDRWLRTGVGEQRGERSNYIRRYLLQQQEGVCAICGIPDRWHGMPLAFVLDHVDGNATNNLRSNLGLVCPNCDSQLPTYKSRNRGRGRAWRSKRYAEGRSY